MKFFNPDENSNRDNYKLLIGTIIPRPIAFVITISKDGKINAAPFSYFNIVSSTPPNDKYWNYKRYCRTKRYC